MLRIESLSSQILEPLPEAKSPPLFPAVKTELHKSEKYISIEYISITEIKAPSITLTIIDLQKILFQ